MKPGKLLKPTLSFSFLLLFALFTTKPPLLASAREAEQQQEEVYSVDGEAIFSGDKYYIVSAITGAGGGGVKPGITEDEAYKMCPVTVVQENSDLKFGVPVKFSVRGNDEPGFIYANTPLQIAFTKRFRCAESSQWVMVSGSEEAWVGIGGSYDHPDEKLLNGTFKIEKSRPFYKLVFCEDQAGHCSDIGIDIYKDGTRRLILDAFRPFMIIFINADLDYAKSSNYIKQVVARGNNV